MLGIRGSTLSRGRHVMAGFFKRAMVYLGLVDDEYDEYEPRDAPAGRGLHRASEPEADEPAPVVATSSIRPLSHEFSGAQAPTIVPRPSSARCLQRQVPVCT